MVNQASPMKDRAAIFAREIDVPERGVRQRKADTYLVFSVRVVSQVDDAAFPLRSSVPVTQDV